MPESLRARTEAIRAESAPLYAAHNERMAAFLERIGQLDRRPGPGSAAPDFALPDAEGALRRLGDLLHGRGAVLIFVRGLWCPYCSAQMRAMEEIRPRFEALGVRLAVITPEIGGRAGETKRRLGLGFDVLCDVGEGVALAYGCLFPIPEPDRAVLREAGYDLATLYGTGGLFMPLPSSFLLGADGRVIEVFGGADQRVRPEPEAIYRSAEAAVASSPLGPASARSPASAAEGR